MRDARLEAEAVAKSICDRPGWRHGLCPDMCWLCRAAREIMAYATAQRMLPEQVDGRTGCPGCDSGGEHNP